MAKIIYEFDPFDEDDRIKLDMLQKATKFYYALWNIKQEVRKIWKYEELLDKDQDLIDRVYELICDEIGDLLDE